MKQATIQIRCDSAQADALRYFMGQKGLVLEADLEGHFSQLFEKHVPRQVQEYLQAKPAKKTKDG
ncbi:MAG: DUF6103 family protein [Oscillospiraceae bacterium]|nr:DUF6103 family protein [Oscillospiraceae bacterium]